MRGNADRELVGLARGANVPVPDEISPWAARQLTADHVDWLAQLPHPVTLEVDGFGAVLFCHGTPRNDEEVVLADTRLERWAEVLADLPSEVTTVVCGAHPHAVQPGWRIGGRSLNPGSVGMPYGRAGAHWALLSGGSVCLRRTDFDLAQACADIGAQSSFPGAADWADYFLHARASDSEALTALALATGASGQKGRARAFARARPPVSRISPVSGFT